MTDSVLGQVRVKVWCLQGGVTGPPDAHKAQACRHIGILHCTVVLPESAVVKHE